MTLVEVLLKLHEFTEWCWCLFL